MARSLLKTVESYQHVSVRPLFMSYSINPEVLCLLGWGYSLKIFIFKLIEILIILRITEVTAST